MKEITNLLKSIVKGSFFAVLPLLFANAAYAQSTAENLNITTNAAYRSLTPVALHNSSNIQALPDDPFKELNIDGQTFLLQNNDQSDQNGSSSSTQNGAAQTTDAQDQRSIVDADNPPKPSLFRRIFIVPFRPIADRTNALLKRYQSSPGRYSKNIGGFSIHPVFGGFHTDSAGIGGGLKFSNANAAQMPLNLTFYSDTRVSFKKYLETTAGISFDPTSNNYNFLKFDLSTHFYRHAQENFFGTGPFSLRSDRTTYDLQERGVTFATAWLITAKLKLGTSIDYTATRIFPGEENNSPTTDQLFTDVEAPGLSEGAALLSETLFVEYDNRDNPKYARSGMFGKLTVATHDSVGRGDYGFKTLQFDTRSYLPLGSKSRVFAMRVIGEFNDPKGGSEIPFFWLPRLGTKDILRGYSPYRFYGRNALASSLEYRNELGRYVDGVLFTDFGQVFNNRSELKWDNVHATFGGGVQFKNSERALFRILVGKSGDGARLILAFGPTF